MWGKRIGRVGLVGMALVGCLGARMPERIITDPGGSFVRVERDPASQQRQYVHPASISPERLRALLQAIEVESPLGPFLGQTVKEQLFDPADLDFLAPAVSNALSQAQPNERVVFYLRQSGRLLRPEITTGAFAVTGDSISFMLGHYRRTDVEGLVQEDRQANLENEILADPMFRVFDRNVRLFVQADQPGRVGETARTILFPRTGMVSRSSPAGDGHSKEPAEPLKAQLPGASVAGSQELQELKTRMGALEVQNAGVRQALDELKGRLADREEKLESLRLDLELIKKAIVGDPKGPGAKGKVPRK